MDASIFDSVLSHTRRSDVSEKEEKIACPLLDVFVCGQVSSPRLDRLNMRFFNLGSFPFAPKLPIELSSKSEFHDGFHKYRFIPEFNGIQSEIHPDYPKNWRLQCKDRGISIFSIFRLSQE